MLKKLLAAAAAVLMCLSIAPKAADSAEITLRFANFPPASTFPCVAAENWISELSKATNGKVKVDHYPAGTLVDARSMVRGILRGQADIGCFSTAYFPGMFPLTSCFELPLGFRSATDATAALFKAIQEFKPAELSKLKVICCFTCPPSQVLSRKPVPAPADIKGLRLRAAGVLADEVSLLGGSPVSMPQSEAPDAIQRGAVDGVFTSLDVVKDLNYAEPCRHILLTNMSVYPFLFVMNMKTWESLPKDVQAAIDSISLPTSMWTGKYVDDHAQEALKWGQDKYGVKAVALTEEQRSATLKTVSPLLAKWEEAISAKGLPAAKMLEFAKSQVK